MPKDPAPLDANPKTPGTPKSGGENVSVLPSPSCEALVIDLTQGMEVADLTGLPRAEYIRVFAEFADDPLVAMAGKRGARG